ncbi:hypothetical protein SAMN05446037_100633 [Anaerovirgula multivorans]|uniref:Uncharacterized protein n=1 Tax=Anaerovirgula multivorans TaxID=312168 RepID=A0A239CMH7_9FIRM|nr:hypothetical protein [Anaerovirgula multivorans]SNS20938.1 hypothetical protein SAMN05446037_100633 [Anaerovirgula multivorans]
MKCDKCGSENIRVWVKVCMYIDSRDYGRLTKKVIAKSTTELWAVDDDKTKFVCGGCNFTWGGDDVRTLYDIISEAKGGKMPTREECYYGMLAYESMFNFDHSNLSKVLTENKERSEFIKDLMLKNSFDMYKGALNKSPKEWLGKNWDPMESACQERRRIANKLFDKVIKKVGENE